MSRPSRATHGTYALSKSCKCDPCSLARRRYDKMQRLKKARGQTNRVDAAPIREHVQKFVDAGATYSQVSRATGETVKESQVRRLMEGNPRNGLKPVRWLYRPTAEALMALKVDEVLSQQSLRPAFGVHRRLQALMYQGHSIGTISAELGVSDEVISRYLRAPRLMTSTLNNVDRVYQKLSMVPGTSERMKWRAYRNEYAPPMAWDEDTIDDPDAKPDAPRCIVERCMRAAYKSSLCESHLRKVKERGGFRSAEVFRETVLWVNKRDTHAGVTLTETLAELKEMGVTVQEAARRTGRAVSHVEKMWKDVA